jgi:hypothetical protein
MNLLQPMTIDGVTTGQLNMVPTKEFFKPVLVLNAPLDTEDALLLGVDYLFDVHGNPRPFEGTHKLLGDLPFAEVTFAGKVTGAVTMRTEKLAHFACYIEEKKAMMLRFRLHFPEDKTKLADLLEFLSTLNKEAFSVTLIPQQIGLPGVGGKYPEADEDGMYPDKSATTRPFSFRIGRHATGIKGFAATLELKDGFIGGWSCNASGLTDSEADNIAGRAFSSELTICPSENEALEHAVRELWEFATNILSRAAKAKNEMAALDLLLEWCSTTVPAIAKAKANPE